MAGERPVSRLQERRVEYLALRRSLGYKLERAGLLLGQFVGYLDAAGVESFAVADATGQVLAYVYFEDEPGRRRTMNRLTT